MFNLIYPVFYVGFICKSCVRESVCEDSRQLKTKAIVAGSSQVSFPRNDACAVHMTGMWRVRTWWRQLVIARVLQVRPSCEILAKHSVLLNYHFWYTLSIPTLYTSPLPHICWGVLLRENPSHKHWELEIVIPTILYTIHCGFSSTPTSPISLHLRGW